MAELMIDGERRTLRLTLGALARLERALGAGSVDALGARLAEPRAEDLLHILSALIGDPALGAEQLADANIDPAAAARAVAAAFLEADSPKREGGQAAACHGTSGSPMACAP